MLDNKNKKNPDNFITKEQFKCLETRFEDYKKYSNWVGGSISLIIAAFLILFGLNLSSEKESIKKLKGDLVNEIHESLGKGEKKPVLILCDKWGNNIADGILDCYLDSTKIIKDQITLNIFVIVKNIGSAHSGEIWIKFYANEPIALGTMAEEEPSFKWYTELKPKDHSLGVLPGGGYVAHHGVAIGIRKDRKTKIKEKLYPFMIRLYYGSSQVDEFNFKIKVSYNKMSSDDSTSS